MIGHLLLHLLIRNIQKDRDRLAKLESVVPHLGRLLKDPAVVLAERKISIGSRNDQAVAVLLLVGFVLLAAVLIPFLLFRGDHSPGHPQPLVEGLLQLLGMFTATVGLVAVVIGFILIVNPGGQMVLSRQGLELYYRRSVVFCPWGLFRASGPTAVPKASAILLPICPSAVSSVELRREDLLLASGRDVRMRVFRFRSEHEVELRNVYGVKRDQLAGLLLSLGQRLG